MDNDLAGLALRHFDEIDEKYKVAFGIKRKKDFNIEEQFETASMQDETREEHQEKAPTFVDWDTLVCAAKEEGFKRAFLAQKAWWAVRLNTKTIPFIKYIAIYQVAPVSKITYYGKVGKIEPYENTGKYKIYLDGEPMKIKKPIGLGNNPYLKPQGPKYAKLSVINAAKTLDDIWG